MDFTFANRMNNIDSAAIDNIFKSAANPEFISLAGGYPEPSLFPNKELAEIAGRVITENPIKALQYGMTNGDAEFIEIVAKRLADLEKIYAKSENIIITSGSTQAIDLSARVFVNEGDIVITEEPSFMGALNTFKTYNANIISIPTDNDGMDLEKLDEVLRTHDNVKLIYIIPTYQNPKGITMSVERRKAFLEVVSKYKVVVLEDNPYGELAFDGHKMPTLKSMDTNDQVIYCGTFSKIICPGLRVGYAVAQKSIIDDISAAKQINDLHSAFLSQIIIREYIKSYDLEALIVEMRKVYEHKCKTMLSAMDEYFPKDVFYTRPGGGLFIWCDLGHGIDTLELAKKAKEKKVVYVPGCSFIPDITKKQSTLRLNYSTMSDERSVEGIKRLAELINEEFAAIKQ